MSCEFVRLHGPLGLDDGFLRDDGAPDAADVFLHATDCERRFDDLHVRQRVEFTSGSNRRAGRPLARHLRPIDASYDVRSVCR